MKRQRKINRSGGAPTPFVVVRHAGHEPVDVLDPVTAKVLADLAAEAGEVSS